MIPWTLLDSAKVPGGGELRLWRGGAEFPARFAQSVYPLQRPENVVDVV
jgi:spermidine synthase